MTKDEWRQEMRRRHNATTAEEREQYAAAIIATLLHDAHLRAATHILVYYPLPDEPDIRPLFPLLREQGKQLFLPAIIGDTELEVRPYRDDSLHEGAYHIPEPPTAALGDLTSIDYALVPGRAFTADGIRLGRGKGYYDRLLTQLSHAYRRGICFPYQIVPTLPALPHDIRMHHV